ncbi:Similar to sps1: Probable serine/threonine-protein kinase Sps1 (Caldanaerobacter subterraneus subsp. tengcongensis (strain DSM 15242 / JCM 11007 / NBRC 100824 / MB4)), partial [Cotesia congregata]
MEYFKSTTLSSYISKVSTTLDYGIKKNRNYFISSQICKALAYLHNLTPSILHKDIKPENILINEELVIKVCDLGL